MISMRFIRNKYGDNAEFLFTDTVSLMCKMGTESIYEDFYKDTEIFDLRKYSKDSNIIIRQVSYSLVKWKMTHKAYL